MPWPLPHVSYRTENTGVAKTYTTKITDTNLQGHSRAALVTARQVVGQPGDYAREGRVNGARGDEDAAVYNLGVAGRNAPAG
jgi:hypothetical protein